MEDTGVVRDHQIETYRSLIQIGTFVLKFLQIINGGAVIALLAYLGEITASEGAAPDLLIPMSSFVLGLVLAGAATLTAYLTQLAVYNEGAGLLGAGRHRWLLWLSIALALLSLCGFAVGALVAVREFAA